MNISMIFHVNTNVPGTRLLLTGGPNVRPTLIKSTQLLLKIIKDTRIITLGVHFIFIEAVAPESKQLEFEYIVKKNYN